MSDVDQAEKVVPPKAVNEDPATESKPAMDGLEVTENAKDDRKSSDNPTPGDNKTADSPKIPNHSESVDTSKKYVLRILSGPHTGAEVDLHAQPSLLGKDNTCDIVLIDDALRDKHVQFSVNDNKIICTPQEGATVFVGGIEIHEEREINAFQAILCGTTLLAIGPKDQIWPTITLPKLKTELDDTKLKENEQHEVDLKDTKKLWHRLLIVSGIVLLILCTVGTLMHISHKKQAKRLAIEESAFPIIALKASIEEVLERHKVATELIKISLSGKRFILSCYVATSREKKDIEKELRQLPKVNFQSLHIYVQEKIIEQAQAMLNARQTLTVVPAAKLDGILIKGYLHSVEQLPVIKSRLLNDITGLNSIETALFSPDEVSELASNLLTQYKLMGLLKIQTVRTGLMVMGNIQASDEPRWKEAQKALKKNFRGICRVLSYVATVAPNAVKQIFFPSHITTVSIPKREAPWIDLKNGDRYFEGALLPSGYKIQSITKKEIRLQKNEDMVTFTLSEL